MVQGPNFAFRHKLTRRAVEQGIPHVQAAEAHRIALLALEREGGDAAELAHHAVACADADAVIRHAQRAGRAAAAASSYREAVVQYERVLVHADLLSTEDHADLEEALAECLSTRDLWVEARDHWERTIDLRRGLADPVSSPGACGVTPSVCGACAVPRRRWPRARMLSSSCAPHRTAG